MVLQLLNQNYAIRGKRDEVVRLAVFSRCMLFVMQILANLLPDHKADAFSPTLSNCAGRLDCILRCALDGFHKWDSKYFLYIAEHGYTFENTYAFFPLFPLTVRILASTMFHLSSLFSFHTCCLACAVLLNNLLFIGVATALFDLTKAIYNSNKFAYLSSAVFCFNPASIFFSAAYTETLYAFFVFKALLAVTSGKQCKASIWFLLSALTRSNGIVNIGFIGYYCFNDFLQSASPKKSIASVVKLVFKVATLCSVVFIPYIAVNLNAYLQHCVDHNHGLVVSDCSNKPVWCCDVPPSIYRHVQNRIWGLGLFSYYEPRKLPNFMLAFPTLALCSYAVWMYFRYRSHELRFLGLRDEHDFDRRTATNIYMFTSSNVFCYAVHCLFLITFAVLFIHVEVVTRMIMSSSPFPYWAAASFIYKDICVTDSKGTMSVFTWRRLSAITKCCIAYCLSYFVVGTVMHTSSLPWT